MLLAGLGCSRAKTVMPYLDKDGVKHGHRVDGSVLLAGLGCSRAKTVTLLPPDNLSWTSLRTSSKSKQPGQAVNCSTPHPSGG